MVATLGTLHAEGDEGAWLANMALVPCLTSLQTAAGKLDPKDAIMPGAFLPPEQAAGQLHQLMERLEADRPGRRSPPRTKPRWRPPGTWRDSRGMLSAGRL